MRKAPMAGLDWGEKGGFFEAGQLAGRSPAEPAWSVGGKGINGSDAFLDRELRAAFRQWSASPAEHRDHLLHSLSGGAAGMIDPAKAGPGQAMAAIEAQLRVCEGRGAEPDRLGQESRRKQAQALAYAGLITPSLVEESLAHIERTPGLAAGPDEKGSGCERLKEELAGFKAAASLAEEVLGPDLPAGRPCGSRRFACEVPRGWEAFREAEAGGEAVHILGPDDSLGAYRAGIDVHFADGRRRGFVPVRTAIEALRRADLLSRREASPMKSAEAGSPAISFEVWETRMVPPESAPSISRMLHHFVAVVEGGGGYCVIRLSSSEEASAGLRSVFSSFLKSFRVE